MSHYLHMESTQPSAGVFQFSHPAMATDFSIIIANQSRDYAQSAARAAFGELDQLEKELSRFVETSDISRIGLLTPGERMRVGAAAMECMQIASHVWTLTTGAFDVTMGPLVDYWKHHSDSDTTEWQEAHGRSGFDKVQLLPESFEVSVEISEMQLDLGAVGKGYAVDHMARLLASDWDISDFVVQGGESSVLAFGNLPGDTGWPIPLRNPVDQTKILDTVHLHRESVSGSGIVVHGHHIIDPRTGLPANQTNATWARGPSAAVTDALSTAMMIMTAPEIEEMFALVPDMGGLRYVTETGLETMKFGSW